MLTTNRRGITKVRKHEIICEMIDATDPERNPKRFHFLYQEKLRLERLIRIEDDLVIARGFMRTRQILSTSNN